MPVYFSAFLRCVGLSTVWIITNYCDPFSAFAILLPASSAEYRIQSVWLFFAVIQLYVADVIPCICVITILFPLTAWCRVISQHIIGLWIECYWRNVNRVITFKQIVTINGYLCPPLIVTEGYPPTMADCSSVDSAKDAATMPAVSFLNLILIPLS